jgi:hypothetical protein
MKLAIASLVSLLASPSSVVAFVPSVARTTASSSSSLGMVIKTGPAGAPAKSKEEDLELTTQVILDYVNSMSGNEEGVSDEDVDEE